MMNASGDSSSGSDRADGRGSPNDSTSSSSSRFSGSDASPALVQGETCEFTGPPTTRLRCRPPRSCRSCLRKAGCMIDARGVCVRQNGTDGRARYDPMLDFIRAVDMNLTLPAMHDRHWPVSNISRSSDGSASMNSSTRFEQSWHFRAGAANYCSPTDPVCQRCIHHSFWRPQGLSPDSRFCVGAGGCLCIDNCEQTPMVFKDNCTGLPVPTSPPIPRSWDMDVDGVWKSVTIGMVLPVLASFAWCARSYRRSSDRALTLETHETARREARDARLARTTPGLEGWRAQREELITKERQLLAGKAEEEEADTLPPSTATTLTGVTTNTALVSTSPRAPAGYLALRDP